MLSLPLNTAMKNLTSFAAIFHPHCLISKITLYSPQPTPLPATFLLINLDLSSLRHFDAPFSSLFIIFLALVSRQPNVWPNINRNVRQWTRTCLHCQRCKVQHHTSASLSTFEIPTTCFSHVHIDLVGPLPPS